MEAGNGFQYFDKAEIVVKKIMGFFIWFYHGIFLTSFRYRLLTDYLDALLVFNAI